MTPNFISRDLVLKIRTETERIGILEKYPTHSSNEYTFYFSEIRGGGGVPKTL